MEAVGTSEICSWVDISYTEITSVVCITVLTHAFVPFLSCPRELLVEMCDSWLPSHLLSVVVKLLTLALMPLTLLNLFNAHLLFH